jgi:hypothetical protein
MSGIFGSLNLNDTDRVFNSTVGQRAIYEVAAEWINARNAELNAALALFVEETTSEHTRRYKLPGGGYLQRRGPDGRPAQVKATGSWDVAFPLEDFAAGMGFNDVNRAYMTVAELDRHIQTVMNMNVNTVRFELLKALFKNTDDTFIDPLMGSLTIKPLANGDAAVYPPVLGSMDEATDDHYLESGYAYTAISDTNNPYATIAGELEEHFGTPTGGADIAVLQPAVVTPLTRSLTDFVPVGDMGIRYGADADLAGALPAPLASIGKVIGRMDGSGVWVVEWRYMPVAATPFLMGIHLGAPKPLVKRIDPADTGLGDGLQLVGEDEEFPFKDSIWRHRFGFGAGNRLNGVVMELAAGAGFTVPTAYA